MARKPTRNKNVAAHVGKHQGLRRTRLGLRVAHHRHSGRRLPWHFTSYAILYFLIAVTGALVLFAGTIARADEQSVQSAILLSGTVNGPPPSSPAVITSPVDQARFQESIVQVEGECTQNLFVEIYRNGAYAGQGICDSDNRFNVTVTITEGSNALFARIKDGSGQYGPNSDTITVFYDVPITSQPDTTKPTTGSVPSSTLPPFLVYTDTKPYGIFVEKTFRLHYEINGGKAPYAISINWGDGEKPSVISHQSEGDYFAEYRFKRKGQFTIQISASDANNQKAFIQTVAILLGPESAAGITEAACSFSASCLISSRVIDFVNRYAWPALLIALLMTFSFWLGEKMVYSELRRRPAYRGNRT